MRWRVGAGRDLRSPKTEVGPVLHHGETLLEQIAPPIGGLDLITDSMRQGHLGYLVGIGGALPAQSWRVEEKP